MSKQFFLLLLVLAGYLVKAQLALYVESGAATFGYNDVRISGKDGTTFSLSKNFNSKISPFFRARINYAFGKRHTVSALYAPLTLSSEGVLSKDVYFQGQLFTSGKKAEYTWKFNSYRLSYQYNLVMRDKFLFAIGLTAKIRDAKIALRNQTTFAEKTNLGVVPLIRVYTEWKFAEQFNLILDGDALVGKQGRAEDVFLGFGYTPFNHLRVKAGYRLLEGGADNDEVYNFSAVHYGVIGAIWTF